MYKNYLSDGCARSGAFINISYALERLKVEGIVDLFNAVKSSRIRRARLVGNVVSNIEDFVITMYILVIQ